MSVARRYSRRPTRVEMRKRRLDRIGAALIALELSAVAAFFYIAAQIDASHGITVAQSLHNWGF